MTIHKLFIMYIYNILSGFLIINILLITNIRLYFH